MKNLSRLLALVLALCLVLPIFTLAEDAPATETPVVEDPVFFTLNGKEYHKSDVDNALYNLYSNGYVESMTDYATAMQYMIEDEVLFAKIDEFGLNQFTDEENAAFLAEAQSEWDAAIEAYVSYFLTEDTEEARAQAYKDGEAYYTNMGYSVEMVAENIMMSTAFELLQAQMLQDVVPATEEEIKAAFEEYAAQDKALFENDFSTYEIYQQYYGYESWYKPEGFRGIIHILLPVEEELLNAYISAQALYEESLSNEGEAATVTKEDVDAALQAVLDSQKAAIDDIYARLEKGETFQALIAEYNTDPGMKDANLEYGYEVHADSTMTWIPEFVAGAFSDKMQQPGDVSDPVVASYGIHILYYLRDIPGGYVEITDTIRTELADYLNGQKQSTAYYGLLDAWIAEYEVVYNEEAILAAGGTVPTATEAE